MNRSLGFSTSVSNIQSTQWRSLQWRSLQWRSLQWALAAVGLLLACGCGGGDEAPLGGGDVNQDPPSRGGSGGGAAAPSELDSGTTPSTPGDAGPYQDYPIFDGSTTPTANHAHGIDAAAAEEERGFADPPDAGPDAQ